MITSEIKQDEIADSKQRPAFSIDVEDTTGGAITMLLVVFALIAVSFVVYTSIYPLGALTGQLNPTLEETLPMRSFPRVNPGLENRSNHLSQSHATGSSFQ